MKVSLLRLSVCDIERGGGVATVTLRSGAQFSGRVNGKLSRDDLLHLSTDRGWHSIDWEEIAAISGAS